MDQIDKAGVLSYFSQLVIENPDMSAAVAAIETLLHFIETNKFETLVGMRAKLRDAISVLTQTDSSVTSISSGCELFLRFITLASLDQPNFQECQKILSERGKLFIQKVSTSRHKIAKLAHPFIRDGAGLAAMPEAKMEIMDQLSKQKDGTSSLTILVHSYSRVVQQVLKEAASAKKRFNVYVTESGPNRSGARTYNELTACCIPTTVVLDAAVAYVMEKVDLVLLGAEGVVESGGIINKIGTYNIAIAAKTMNKPTYVVAESFKFHRFYPLNQRDLPNHFKYHATTMKESDDLSKEHPLVDYTPPAYITLLFTDLGVLTPSAVSDELIKLYC